MKSKKIKNVKQNDIIKDVNEDTDQIRKFIFILCGVALVALMLYFVSSKYLIKDGVSKDNISNPETISYNNVNVGNVFNRPYDEYYVFAFDPDSLDASIYSSLMNSFDTKKAKMYFLNMGLEVNQKAKSESGNKTAKNSNELKLKEPTLIKIKKGSIDKYLESREEIEKELSSITAK